MDSGERREKTWNRSERRGEWNKREQKNRSENRDSHPTRDKHGGRRFFPKKSRPAAVIEKEKAQGCGEDVEEGEIACERDSGLQRDGGPCGKQSGIPRQEKSKGEEEFDKKHERATGHEDFRWKLLREPCDGIRQGLGEKMELERCEAAPGRVAAGELNHPRTEHEAE